MPSDEKSCRARRLSAHSLGAVAALGLTACPGTIEDPERFIGGATGSEPCTEPSGIFAASCALANCHATSMPALGLDLESPGFEQRLIDVPAMGGGTLVVPGDAESSVLYTKLTEMPPFGLRMPSGRPPLSQAQIDCVGDWITGLGGGALVVDAGDDVP